MFVCGWCSSFSKVFVRSLPVLGLMLLMMRNHTLMHLMLRFHVWVLEAVLSVCGLLLLWYLAVKLSLVMLMFLV